MPRQVAMYLCKKLTHASLPEIGRSFGGKHHSTVIHSIKKVEEHAARRTPNFNTLVGELASSRSSERPQFPQLRLHELWTAVDGAKAPDPAHPCRPHLDHRKMHS